MNNAHIGPKKVAQFNKYHVKPSAQIRGESKSTVINPHVPLALKNADTTKAVGPLTNITGKNRVKQLKRIQIMLFDPAKNGSSIALLEAS